MKKYILLPLLFLGVCSIQSPVWAVDGATDDSVSIECDDNGQCEWNAAIKDSWAKGGETVSYGSQNKKTASEALADTQGTAKQSGLGGSRRTQ